LVNSLSALPTEISITAIKVLEKNPAKFFLFFFKRKDFFKIIDASKFAKSLRLANENQRFSTLRTLVPKNIFKE
jgi:hypothetical protein